jgi:hypothetical protein
MVLQDRRRHPVGAVSAQGQRGVTQRSTLRGRTVITMWYSTQLR